MMVAIRVSHYFTLFYLVFLDDHRRVESTDTRKIIYALALKGESQTETCLRNLGLPVPKSNIDPISWDFAKLEAVAASLNRSVALSASYGIKGCCSPGMWCDQSGCFTHSYGTFANFGWLNGNNSSVPVFSCFLTSKVSAPSISYAVYDSGQLTLAGTNFLADSDTTSISIGTESCDFLSICNSHQCRKCPNNLCPVDSVCLLDGNGASCYMYCGGSSDAACPCGSFCDVVEVGYAGYRRVSLSLCTYQYFSAYGGSTCASFGNYGETTIKCQSPRASQATAIKATSGVSLSIATGAQHLPASKQQNLPPSAWCQSKSDCFDGNICTADTCVNGFCRYVSVPGCDSIPQSTRERTAPYVYNMYSQISKALQQSNFESQMQNLGSVHVINSDSNFIISTLVLPFKFSYFGTVVKSLSVMASGVINLPPVPARDCLGNARTSSCITFSTLSNTIAPLSSAYDFSHSGLSRVILLPQTKGDGSLIYGTDATAFHVLFQRFRNSSDSSLKGATFSVSIYMDGSIRFRYHRVPITPLDPIVDYAGLWGSRISDAQSAYLRYHNESIPSSLITNGGGGTDVVFCSIPNVIACVVESCVSPSKPLLLVWGTGLPPTCTASVQPIVSCVWGGLVSTKPSYVIPSTAQRLRAGNGNFTQLLLCPVPFLNITDGTVLSVSIIVTASDSIPILTPVQTATTGSHTTYGVSVGQGGELARTVLMVRYYSSFSTHDFKIRCGCNALRSYSSQMCDANAVCGGLGALDGVQDCNSDPFGNAYVDSCGICAGGGTQRIPTTSCNPEAGTSSLLTSTSGESLVLIYKIIIGISVIVSLSCLLSALLYLFKWYFRGPIGRYRGDAGFPGQAVPTLDPGLLDSELLAIGVEYVATPRSVVISPQTDGVAVELSVTPLKEGFLKILGIELSIYNVVHRLYTDLNGNIHFNSELSSPYEYLGNMINLKNKNRNSDSSNNNNNNNNNDNNNNNNNCNNKNKNENSCNLLSSIYQEGVETTVITIAPAAPSLDLLPAWETQHFENNYNRYSIKQLLALQSNWGGSCNDNNYNNDDDDRNNNIEYKYGNDNMFNNFDVLSRGGIDGGGGGGGEGYVDRIAPLSLCPGEIRCENVHAVLQPLLTAVRLHKRNENENENDNENENNKDEFTIKNSFSSTKMKMKTKLKMKSEDDMNKDNDKEKDIDIDIRNIADDIRITIHQWSRPIVNNMTDQTSTSTGTRRQTQVQSQKLSNNKISDSFSCVDQELSPKLKSNNLIKSSLLQKDFSGPLKIKMKKEELNSFRSKTSSSASILNCKLIGFDNNTNNNDTNNNDVDKNKNNITNNTSISKMDSNTSFSSSSLSMPLRFQFQFSPDVVAYRIDVETLALDSGKNNDSFLHDQFNYDRSPSSSQLYMRRSSLYIRVQHTPSVEMLSMNVIDLPRAVVDEIPLPEQRNEVEKAGEAVDDRNKIEENKNHREDDDSSLGVNRFIVIKVRNDSRLMAAISTNQKVAEDVLYQHIVRSRQHHTTQQQNIPTNIKNEHAEFAELLDPESTRNMIIPIGVWKRKNNSNPGKLFWALYDPFSSSSSSYSTSSLNNGFESSSSNQYGILKTFSIIDYKNFKGSVRSGAVSGFYSTTLLNSFSSVKPYSSDSNLTSLSPISHQKDFNSTLSPTSYLVSNINKNENENENKNQLGIETEIQSQNGNNNFPRNILPIKASLLLLEENIPIMSSTHPMSQRNTLQTWQYYNVEVEVFSSSASDTSSLPSTKHSSLSLVLPSSAFVKNEIQLFEILVSIKSKSEIFIEKEIKNENIAIINGKIRFKVSSQNPTEFESKNKQKSRIIIMKEKLQICFPTVGMFSVDVLCRPLGCTLRENNENQKHFSISTLSVEVHD